MVTEVLRHLFLTYHLLLIAHLVEIKDRDKPAQDQKCVTHLRVSRWEIPGDVAQTGYGYSHSHCSSEYFE